jgi:hypothetical protein
MDGELGGDARLFWRRMMYALLLLAGLAATIWFVKYVTSGTTENPIGNHYKQADEFGP